jgi:hypothetical protein
MACPRGNDCAVLQGKEALYKHCIGCGVATGSEKAQEHHGADIFEACVMEHGYFHVTPLHQFCGNCGGELPKKE